MADTLSVLRTLVDRSDVRNWAALYDHTVEEEGDNLVVEGHLVTFDESGRLVDVGIQTPAGIPL